MLQKLSAARGLPQTPMGELALQAPSWWGGAHCPPQEPQPHPRVLAEKTPTAFLINRTLVLCLFSVLENCCYFNKYLLIY